jgi:hypothetical protein
MINIYQLGVWRSDHSAPLGTQGSGFDPGLFHKACYLPLR